MTAGHLKFRADIEGLRGIAILSVVLYHVGGVLPGGLTGVDIFFVISGFLITGILLREWIERESIDLAGFWARRARRILPAATLVLLATAAMSPFLVSPLLLKQVGRDIMTAGFFGLNWRAASRAVDYSAPGDDASPVLHYWSLAVEEQFYLVWPLAIAILFLIVRRAGLKPLSVLAGLSAALIAASFAYCVMVTEVNQPLAFFSTLSRVWQLLAGAVIAAFVVYGAVPRSTVADILGPAGLAMILAGFFVINPESGFPGWIAAMPVAGAAAVILAGSRAEPGWTARVLSNAPLCAVGRVSYVWYLWHSPLLFFGAAAFPQGGLGLHLLFAALSFGAAVATHHLLENPLRFHPWLVTSRLRSLLMGAGLAAVSVVAGIALTQFALGRTVTLSDGTRLVIEDVTDDRSPAYRSDCHIAQIETRHEDCVFGTPNARPEVVLFGDSHAAHFFNAVEAASRERNTAFLMRSKSGCAAVDGPMWNNKFRRQYVECDEWKAGVLQKVAELRPKLVILSSATLQRMMPEGGTVPADEATRPELYKAALHRMIGKLLQSAGTVVLIKDTPRLPEEPLLCLYRNPGNESACTWPAADVTTGDFYVPDLSGFGERVKTVDLAPEICPDGECRAVRGGQPVFYDQSHFTATYSLRFKDTFVRLLADAGV